MSTIRDAKDPPKKNGRYMVKFYFPNRHPTDRTELAYRNFENGKWDRPYYSQPNEGSVLLQWFEEVEL